MSDWTLHLGDCLDPLKGLASLPDRSVDAVITDPPYSSGGQFRGDRTQATSTKYVGSDTKRVLADYEGDNRDQRSYAYWCTLWMLECQRISVPGAPLCVFCDWRQLPTVTDAVQAAGWVWRGIAVWDKTEAARPQAGRFRSQSEFLVWGTNGPMDQSAAAEVGCLPGVFRMPASIADKVHQAEKPEDLMAEIVRIARRGSTVLDPFAGSGTTGVAAIRTGRRFVGFEKSATYHAAAVKRLSAAREQLEIFGGAA